MQPGPAGEQAEEFPAYRYHACFTDSPISLQAESQHRHAIIERAHSDMQRADRS